MHDQERSHNRKFNIERDTAGIAIALSVNTTQHSTGVMKGHVGVLLNATDAWKHLANDDLMTASVVNMKHAPRRR